MTQPTPEEMKRRLLRFARRLERMEQESGNQLNVVMLQELQRAIKVIKVPMSKSS